MLNTSTIYMKRVRKLYIQMHLNSLIIFLMGKMDLVGTEEIMNIRLQLCEFELQITTWNIQMASLFVF